MRKCQMCGYLALTEGETCKHCGALLPRVMAAALANAGETGPAPPPPPTTSATRAPVERDYWSPPTTPVPTTAPRSKSRALLALITLVSMAIGWVAVDHFLPGEHLPKGTSDFVAGHGVSYTSPDHTFQARFPAPPTIQQKPMAVGTSSATLDLAQVQTDDYEVVAASMVLPLRIPSAQVDGVLHEILKAGTTAQGSTIVHETRVVHDGVPGIEVRAKVSDGYAAKLMVLISGSRVYLLGVHARSGTDRLYDALVASLLMT